MEALKKHMNRMITNTFVAAVMLTLLEPADLSANRRVVVRRGPAGHRTAVVVHPGHPIRRAVARTVVVRPARTRVLVAAPLFFLPAVVWGATIVSLPARDRLIWEDSEVIHRDEEWVDSNFGVDRRGDALYLEVDGRAHLDYAEVTFENGQVQVVDFQDRVHKSGLYTLLDFADGRHVKTVRLLAKSQTDKTKFTVYMRK
jgi:hypothetical protein